LARGTTGPRAQRNSRGIRRGAPRLFSDGAQLAPRQQEQSTEIRCLVGSRMAMSDGQRARANDNRKTPTNRQQLKRRPIDRRSAVLLNQEPGEARMNPKAGGPNTYLGPRWSAWSTRVEMKSSAPLTASEVCSGRAVAGAAAAGVLACRGGAGRRLAMLHPRRHTQSPRASAGGFVSDAVKRNTAPP
jgi:hypothetical protein